MALIRWTLHDPVLNETYTFHINPNEGGTPTREKKIEYESPAAPDGTTLIFEGRDEPLRIEFSGAILEQVQLDSFVYWFKKRNKVRLTDDLGRQFWVYLTAFNPTRQWRISHPWKHTYNATAILVEE